MRAVLAAVVVALFAVSAEVATGDGGTGPGILQGGSGVAQGSVRFVAVPAGRATILEAVKRDGGIVLRTRSLTGNWGVPVIALDGQTEGLTRDGGTLVLAAPSTQALRKVTRFQIVDTQSLVAATLRIKGDFLYDALSPDARFLYLIERLDVRAGAYRVRVYDLRKGKLSPRVIADRTSWETEMRGLPVTRVTSRDGSWAYTLYGGADRPFIHALDLRHGIARCIDMPWRNDPKGLLRYRLRLDGAGRLVVRGPRGRTLAVVDRSSLRVLSSVANP